MNGMRAAGRLAVALTTEYAPDTNLTQTCVLFIRWSVELVELYTRPLERRKGLHLVTGPYLYTHAPEGSAYLPKRWACTTGW